MCPWNIIASILEYKNIICYTSPEEVDSDDYMNDAELQSFFSGTPVEPVESWPSHSLPTFGWVEAEHTANEIIYSISARST